ncbi:hypothetical protein [Ekhidna sp.]|uniref:hypothetical protein n=1 Tax=Ekhidna sp. TaxID=2608089 RepID=UPI003C7E2825
MRRLIVILFIVSCTASSEEKLHQQSVETHDLAIKIGEHVKEKIEQIYAQADQLEDPLKSLLKDSVRTLTRDYEYWKSTIMEVPGHEHEHHEHDHAGHNHDHSPEADLTPEMVLEIQKDLRDRVVLLNIRAQKLLDTLRKKNEDEPIKEKEKASSNGA